MMKRLKLIVMIMAVMSLILAANYVSAGFGDWPMFHHDSALSGVSETSALGNLLLWKTVLPDTTVKSSPAIADGKLYIGADDGKLYCLDSMTGAIIWAFDSGKAIKASPAVKYGSVFFLSTNGNLYAVNAGTGALIWSTAVGTGLPWDWSSPAVENDNVYIGTSNGFVHSVVAATGAINWSTGIGGSPDSPISVANGKVYSGTHNFDNSSPTLVCLNEATGAIIWTYNYHLYHGGVVGMVNSNGATIADGDMDGDLEVYFGVYNWSGVSDQAVCLNEATGLEEWTQFIGGNSTSTPAVDNGVIFIGSDDGNLYALDGKNSGAILGTAATGGQVLSAPALGGGQVVFGATDHVLYVVDLATATLAWSFNTGLSSRLLSSPAIAKNIIYAADEAGKIFAFASSLDIKPYSCPNSINRNNKGKIPVAILSLPSFDATQVDVSSVEFACASPLPIGESPEDLNGDGLLDIVLHFNVQDLCLPNGKPVACLSGTTYGGVDFVICDTVRIVH